jgi:mevalonate kinase
MLVESFANALGTCSVVGVSAFATKSFQVDEWCVFANCMNAYQELMCACGMSQPLADLFNYRSDAFSYVFGYPFGSKLTGAGRGGDFVVVAPNRDLQGTFETFRHEVKIARRLLPCHFRSWEPSESSCEGVTIVEKGNGAS